jgi:hypothetical protein
LCAEGGSFGGADSPPPEPTVEKAARVLGSKAAAKTNEKRSREAAVWMRYVIARVRELPDQGRSFSKWELTKMVYDDCEECKSFEWNETVIGQMRRKGLRWWSGSLPPYDSKLAKQRRHEERLKAMLSRRKSRVVRR